MVGFVGGPVSSGQDAREEGRVVRRPRKGAWVLALLLLAAAARLIYAWNLAPNYDERFIFDLARRVSLAPGRFFFPFATSETRHPGLAIWLAAAANWLGGGVVNWIAGESANWLGGRADSGTFAGVADEIVGGAVNRPGGGSDFAIRSFFVLAHVAGLYGLFLLTREFFGTRAALLALALGAIDRAWIVASAQVLESGFFFIAPWALLLSWRCVRAPTLGRWLALGFLLAAGYLYYELALFLLVPLGFLLAGTHEGRRALRSAGPYLAAAIVAAVVVVHAVVNAQHRGASLAYASSVLTGQRQWALSPRVLLLYVGDLLIPFKNMGGAWSLAIGDEIYGPWNVPCLWGAGAAYLCAVAASLFSPRFSARRTETVFLLVAFFSAALPVSVVGPRAAWNNFHYAAQTLVPAIALAAWQLDRLLKRRAVRPGIVALALASLAAWVGAFLLGPKWGYFTLDAEKADVGRVYYLRKIRGWDETRLRSSDLGAIRDLLVGEAYEHNVAMQCLLADYGATPQERAEALARARRIDPASPLVALRESDRRSAEGDLAGAREALLGAMDREWNLYKLPAALANVELDLGNCDEAIRRARQALAIQPDASPAFETLFLAYDALGRTAEARGALEVLYNLSRRPRQHLDFYIASVFLERREYEKAAAFVDEGLGLDPENPVGLTQKGVLCANRGQRDEAIALFDRVLEKDPGNQWVRSVLETLRDSSSGVFPEKLPTGPPRRSPGAAGLP